MFYTQLFGKVVSTRSVYLNDQRTNSIFLKVIVIILSDSPIIISLSYSHGFGNMTFELLNNLYTCGIIRIKNIVMRNKICDSSSTWMRL